MIKSFCYMNICLIIALIMASGCRIIEGLHPELVKRGEEFPGSHKCGDCHIDIYNEWAESPHSKSYTSERFRVSTNNYEFKFCLRCHVPETIFTALESGSDNEAETVLSKPKDDETAPRDYNLKDGVDCHACHLTMDCKLSGPHAGISPHPVIQDEEFYKKSELCGKCHVDTFEEYLTCAGNGSDKTCQDCHMPVVKRKLIQNEPWQRLHVRKEGKKHTFSSSSALKNNKDFIELTFAGVRYGDNQINGSVEILNTKVNHYIPTGKYGYREVLLTINLKNSMGSIIRSKQDSMFLELDTQLKPGEKKIYSFTFDTGGEGDEAEVLEAILFRTNFNRTEKTLLAKAEAKVYHGKTRSITE